MRTELIDGRHLARRAVIYIRQSTPHQVLTNLSGAAAVHREGFKDLIARVTLGQVGIVLSSEVTRLSRNCTDWYPLLDLCGYRQCLIGDRDGVYDPASANNAATFGSRSNFVTFRG